jgi:hypothetical protein
MENTLAVVCVLLGGVLVLTPALFLFLLLVWPTFDLGRHTPALALLILLVIPFAALRARLGGFTFPGVFSAGSLLLTYGVAALAHASRAATLSAVGIALLGSIVLWGGLYLVRIFQVRRRRGRSPTETAS